MNMFIARNTFCQSAMKRIVTIHTLSAENSVPVCHVPSPAFGIRILIKIPYCIPTNISQTENKKKSVGKSV